MKETLREKLIDVIIDMAGDEIETPQDVWKFAKMTEEQLADEVINIAQYYRNQANDDFKTFNEAPYGKA
jgi:hypothetical protein